MGEIVRKKIIPDIDVDTKEEILSEEVFESIIELLCDNIVVDSEYEKGYRSNDPFEEDEPASMNVTVEGELSLSEIKKHFIVTETALELIRDAFDCLDSYDFAEDTIREAVDEQLPYGFSQGRVSIMVNFKQRKDDAYFVLNYEILSYDFDNYEFIESMRPEPDPYDY